jgi:potassium-transporting ATPase potassium-binding subunit
MARLSPTAIWKAKKSVLASPTRPLWASVTTAASNGSVNSHARFLYAAGRHGSHVDDHVGGSFLWRVGSGLYGMLAFVILAVFVAGLMVGRTPEYLGKKIQTYEMKMASIMILIPPLLVLVCTAVAVATGGAGTNNPGAHGFSEILYAFDSMSNNNGSAFAGLSGNTLYNLMGGAAMWFGRFWLAIPVLAMAGSLAKKKVVPAKAREPFRPIRFFSYRHADFHGHHCRRP